MDKFKFISLGNHCGIKVSLRNIGINQEIFPFDYIVTDNENELISKIYSEFNLINPNYSRNEFS